MKTTTNARQTVAFGTKLAKLFSSGVIALSGELGSGKTTFTQGFAKGLGIKERIISPTFTLIRQHKIPKNKKTFYHIDLYRLEKMEDFIQIDLGQLAQNPNNIILIEWAQKAKKILPKNTLWINFKIKKGNNRQITVTNFPAGFQL